MIQQRKLNVLQINASDKLGGAAIAAGRLAAGLRALGHDVSFLVASSTEATDHRVARIKRNPWSERLISKITGSVGYCDINCTSTWRIAKHSFFKRADIVHFHNLHGGYFNYLALPHLTNLKPSFLTLHDMWSFTGHCAYSFDCDRWKIGCGKCPDLKSYPAIRRDSTQGQFRLKRYAYKKSRLNVISPSKWLTDLARQSTLGDLFSLHHIPYGIDSTVYHPVDPACCRKSLGLSPDAKTILMAADSLSDPRKGADVVCAALRLLPQKLKRELTVLSMGRGDCWSIQDTGMNVVGLGFATSERLKALAYSAADVFVQPTRADNLPLMLQESMACGTPMISTNVGGVPELVRPGVTGFLVEKDNSHSLAETIVHFFADPGKAEEMSKACRRIAVDEFSILEQAERVGMLYQEEFERNEEANGSSNS